MPLQTGSSYHPLFYVGSDERFHYFSHLNVWYWRHFGVARFELSLAHTFPRRSGESELMLPGDLEKALAK